MILGEKSERRDQSSFSCLVNINFRKSLPRAPEFEYPPQPMRTILYSYTFLETGRTLNQDIFTLSLFLQT